MKKGEPADLDWEADTTNVAFDDDSIEADEADEFEDTKVGLRAPPPLRTPDPPAARPRAASTAEVRPRAASATPNPPAARVPPAPDTPKITPHIPPQASRGSVEPRPGLRIEAQASRVPVERPASRPPPEAHAPTALTPEIQEQLYEVVAAALDATMAPLVAKQRELEARLEAIREEARRAPPAAAAAPRSMMPTSYGYVIQPEGGSKRPPMDVALEKVGPIEVPDFGGSRNLAARIVVFVLLAAVVAAILATILSYH